MFGVFATTFGNEFIIASAILIGGEVFSVIILRYLLIVNTTTKNNVDKVEQAYHQYIRKQPIHNDLVKYFEAS